MWTASYLSKRSSESPTPIDVFLFSKDATSIIEFLLFLVFWSIKFLISFAGSPSNIWFVIVVLSLIVEFIIFLLSSDKIFLALSLFNKFWASLICFSFSNFSNFLVSPLSSLIKFTISSSFFWLFCVFSCNAVFLFFKNNFNSSPLKASILLTPEDIELSLIIENSPILLVVSTCVPPHNYKENVLALSWPIDITLTSSPYFSPNNAIAPFLIALSGDINLVVTLLSCLTK